MKALSHAQNVLVNRLAVPVGAFVVLVAIGRHSDALLGQYALVMTFYFIMQMVPLLGLTSYVMREVARDPAAAGRYLSTVGSLSMAGCVLVDAATWIALKFLHYPVEVKQAIAMVGLLICPGILLFIAEILFMSVHRARPIAVVAVWENVARVALSLVFLDSGLTALMGVFLLTRLGALVTYLLMLRRMGVVPRWEPVDLQLLRRTLHLLPSFLAGTLLLALFSRLDFFVLSLYEPVESIGYYAIGYRPYEISIMVLTALLMAVFPRTSRVFAREPRRYARWSREAILGFGGALAVASLFGVLLAHDYVYLLFHRQFPMPVPLTELYMAFVVLAGLDYVVGALLHASDRQQADTRAMVFGGLAQLGLLFALIPGLGIYGAFVAKVAATFVQASLKFLLLRAGFGRILRPGDAWRIAVVGLALGLGAWAVLETPWPVRWLGAFVLSFGALPLLCLATGLLQPLRWLRSRWYPRHAREPNDLLDLADLVVSDAREHARRNRARPRRLDRELAALLFYRLARYLYLRRSPLLAACVGRSGGVLTRRSIDPASPERPAWKAA